VSLDTQYLVRLRRDLPQRAPEPATDFGEEARKRRQPALLVERLANAFPSQTDDIRAHRQQNGDTYSDNDQEEFAHCSVSRRAQRKAAGIVLRRQANAAAFAKGPPSRRAFRKSRWDRYQIATP
jgi:hypothetical protein